MENIDWYKDQSRIHYVAQMIRPGVMLFSTLIEYIHFPPRDPMMNAIFHFEPVSWMEMGWYITTIPKEYKSKANKIADNLFLRIQDGVPTIIGGKERVVQFPMNFPNVWTVENKEGGPKRMYMPPKKDGTLDPLYEKELELTGIINRCTPKGAIAIMEEYHRVKGDISQIGKE